MKERKKSRKGGKEERKNTKRRKKAKDGKYERRKEGEKEGIKKERKKSRKGGKEGRKKEVKEGRKGRKEGRKEGRILKGERSRKMVNMKGGEKEGIKKDCRIKEMNLKGRNNINLRCISDIHTRLSYIK